jgi:small subunit ribosomal protein S5
MAELLDESSHLESTTLGVYRTAATVKGGRRFSFGALVVVGDRRGNVGYGYGKANEVPPAIEKAQKEGRKSLKKITLQGGTIPHEVTGRFGAAQVKLLPASPGTGVVAGAPIRAILEMAGVTDCLTKCYGSTNTRNVVKAAMNGLVKLQFKDEVAELRGVQIGTTRVDEMIERGQAYLPSAAAGERMQAPVNTVGDRAGGRGGRRGGGGGRGRGGSGGGGRRPAEAPSAPKSDDSSSSDSGESSSDNS